MRHRPVLAAIAAAACVGCIAGHAHAAPGLLRPGQYHRDEVTAVSGERWLALVHPLDGPDRVAATKIHVDRVRDEIVDDDDAPFTGKDVWAAPRERIEFMVKDVPGVRDGVVESCARHERLEVGTPLGLALANGTAMVVALDCDAPTGTVTRIPGNEGEGMELVACRLSVTVGERTQVLKTYSGYVQDGKVAAVGDDAGASVLWAGDLNRDGAIDLLIDLTEHYNLSRPTLFLSTGKSDGPPLVKVAQHESYGC